jgi:hypothetical protein
VERRSRLSGKTLGRQQSGMNTRGAQERHGRTATRLVLALGLVVFAVGAALRLWATDLAWPSSYKFSGPREMTQWAILESALKDIALATMILGSGLMSVAVHHLLRARSSQREAA